MTLAAKAEAPGNAQIAESATTFAEQTLNKYLEWQNADAPPGQSPTTQRLDVSLADQAVSQLPVKGDPVIAQRESHELLVETDRRMGEFLADQGCLTGHYQTRLDRLKRLRRAVTVQSFALFIVSSDRRQAYRLFSALNDRGRSLSDGDLLRSRTLEPPGKLYGSSLGPALRQGSLVIVGHSRFLAGAMRSTVAICRCSLLDTLLPAAKMTFENRRWIGPGDTAPVKRTRLA